MCCSCLCIALWAQRAPQELVGAVDGKMDVVLGDRNWVDPYRSPWEKEETFVLGSKQRFSASNCHILSLSQSNPKYFALLEWRFNLFQTRVF